MIAPEANTSFFFDKFVTATLIRWSNGVMESGEDILLIEKTLAGDVQAFEQIVRKYQSMIFTIAIRILQHHEEAEEVAQDVFIKAYKSLSGFNKKSKFSTWIYKIAYNTTVSKLRSRKKFHDTTGLQDFERAGSTDMVAEQEKMEENEIIRKCILRLPENERIIVTLFYFEDHSIREIAEITGISESNVKVKLFRSRQLLYHELQQKLNLEPNHEYAYK
ncbi:MAG TPA: hypothetical protein DCX89_00965 [Saprospirales bacterium]|nr:hypothetical protein [Saprospirales bacterium]HAY70436.1 hypothetical protein [Saprospirales bacterium]HRQ29705.1 RNA polymerase sigma factor [Saprospiraceae bacterium]